MMLALAPILLMLATGILGMLGHALGLTPPSGEWLSPRVASGGLAGMMLWFVSFFVRAMLREHEAFRATQLARDALLREQNPEFWQARQEHEATVRAKTAEILTAMRAQPLHRRVRDYLRPEQARGR